jgi:hypothetical protein
MTVPMTAARHEKGRHGFSRTELVVVVVVLSLLLAAIGIPVVQRSRLSGQLNGLVANAKSISLGCGRPEPEEYVTTSSSWPAKGALDVRHGLYPDSTEYFRHHVANGNMNVPFSYFAAVGIPAVGGQEPERFRAENNAWSVTAGLTDMSDEETPFVMLRNLEIDRLSQPIWDGTTLWIGTGKRDPRHLKPYGVKAFVFVPKGGSGYGLTGAQMRPETVTNLFRPGTNDLPILHPWP